MGLKAGTVSPEALGGLALIGATLLALLAANGPWAAGYQHLLHLPVSLGFDGASFEMSLLHWINDGLMAVFFLSVGMELKHEMVDGQLRNPSAVAMPGLAALGGLIAPGLIYLAITAGHGVTHGWAVPTATDIAFAVGVLALLGRGLPPVLRVFLLTLAIIDDLVAVLIIALFYSGGLQWPMFGIAALGLAGVLLLQQLGVRRAWAYVPAGAVLWWGIWQTGAHPTLAGVVLGLVTPVHALAGREPAPPVQRVQASLHPWVTFGVMPLFALANAGVALGSAGGAQPGAPGAGLLMAAVALALVAGKPLGVLLACWLAVRLRLCALPAGMGWGGLLLTGLLAGIGFTMAIFIATLAFDSAALLAAAKRGVLLASGLAALLGLAWGWWLQRRATTA